MVRAALHVTRWGLFGGRERKPCIEDPTLLKGEAIGMYHCPGCGMMVVAALPHPNPGVTGEQKDHPLYPLDDYEVEYGRPWPDGYYSRPRTLVRLLWREIKWCLGAYRRDV